MWKWLKGVALSGVKGALKAGVAKMDDLQPRVRALIVQKGPDAADAIVDEVQDWLNGVIDRSI